MPGVRSFQLLGGPGRLPPPIPSPASLIPPPPRGRNGVGAASRDLPKVETNAAQIPKSPAFLLNIYYTLLNHIPSHHADPHHLRPSFPGCCWAP